MRARHDYAEPFKIKTVEPIHLPSRQTRAARIEEAGFNVFNLQSEDVYIDLLTDSGTTAMSTQQWAAMIKGDESYAGSRSYKALSAAVADVMGFPYVLPTHQGRGAEHILMTMKVQPDDRIPGNMHFDTTEGHIRLRGAHPINLLAEEGYQRASTHPFKGNIDLDQLAAELSKNRERIPLVLMTITCNNNGGQPVSLANLRAAAEIAHAAEVPIFLDAARFAENAYFIQTREPGYENHDLRTIARECFSLVDGCTFSAKKDGLVNIGGLLAFWDIKAFEEAIQWQIPFEGFITYGGLAGRDLEAIAVGLREVINPAYLENRIGQVHRLASRLYEAGVPVIMPPGGHGVFIDAGEFFPHLPPEQFPGQAFVVELYLEGAIRAVELGSAAFGRRDPTTGEHIAPRMEMVRLAIPRRVYTDRHLEQVAQAVERVYQRRSDIQGFDMIKEAPVLRHFTAQYRRREDD